MQENRHEEQMDIDYELEKQEYELKLIEQDKGKYPKLVFKYKSLENRTNIKRMIHLLQYNKIYLPKADELNDPLEGYRCKMLDDYAVQQKEEIGKYRILAFSEDGFLSTLWAYYADDYKGICLVYRTDQTFSELEPVKYVEKHSTRTWSVDPELTVREDIKYKSVEWAHEKEWRYVRKTSEKQLDYTAHELVCVLLGPNMEAKTRKKIMSKIPTHVKTFTVEADTDGFCLYAKDDAGNRAYNTQELVELITLPDNK